MVLKKKSGLMEGTYSEDSSLSVVFSVLSLLSTESCLAHGIQAETGSASNSSPSLSLSLSLWPPWSYQDSSRLSPDTNITDNSTSLLLHLPPTPSYSDNSTYLLT